MIFEHPPFAIKQWLSQDNVASKGTQMMQVIQSKINPFFLSSKKKHKFQINYMHHISLQH